ncbi:MAG: PTS sugar transporter subunit IIA [Erysipelotrichaceae bacterium]|nr:PTS sugar transporter subunit IIA [Erysipelotrichaceae bacterium]
MLINREMISINADLKNKDEVIAHSTALMDKAGKLNDALGYKKAVYDREAEITTNLGDGIAMPHARSSSVKEAGLTFMRLKEAIPWEGGDQPISLVFGIAAPETGGDIHLKILAKLARKLIYPEFKEKLFAIDNEDELLALIEEATGGLE